jgi:hypothetical protein
MSKITSPNPSLSPAPKHSDWLAHLVPLWPNEQTDMTPAGRLKRLGALRKALRSERQRGLQGHWAYDLARHAALLRAYRNEQAGAPVDAKRRR